MFPLELDFLFVAPSNSTHSPINRVLNSNAQNEHNEHNDNNDLYAPNGLKIQV